MPNKPKMTQSACEHCNQEYVVSLHDLKRGRRFCSLECTRKAFTIETEVQCFYCQKLFMKKTSTLKKSKHQIYFCTLDCKYSAASDKRCSYQTGPKYQGVKRSTYRTQALRLQDNKCARCGYNEHVQLLDVDHIDSNRKNNDISNLQILCVMCHALKTRLPHHF